MGGGFKTLSTKENDKADRKLSSANIVDDYPANGQVDIEINNDQDEETETEKEDKFEQLQLNILVFMYLEKFMEIIVIFLVTATAIFWKPMRNIIQILFWPLLGVVVVASILLTVCHRLQWFRQFPGFILYKLLYLFFLFAIFMILALHVPVTVQFLSPYYALVALGSVAATYIFFILVIVTHTHLCKCHPDGYSLGVYVLCILTGLLLINQPIYLYGGVWHPFTNYMDFMLNTGFGILVSLIFSYETLTIYRKFVASDKLYDFLDSKWLLPGLATVYFARDRK